mgnify:CR=1 FL=1
MKKLLITIFSLILIALAAYFTFRTNNGDATYRTEKISRGDIVMSITATGTVNAVTTVQVGTQVSGTIKEIFVDFNSPVRKGQIIAKIDPALFEAQEEQANANLQVAKANLLKAEAALTDTKRNLERARQLYSKNLIAQSEVDTAETNYDTARASVSAAKSQILQAEASLKLARTNLRYTNILSPVDGIVISRNVDVGQTVAASFQTPTLFSIAQDLTKMQIDANVDEADIGKIKVGQDVEFTVDAYPDSPFKGKVWQIRSSPQTVQNVVTYDVVIKVDNPEYKLKPGMTANVSVIIETKENVLRVPNAALRFKIDEKVKKTSDKKGAETTGVWILEQKKPRRVRVTTGISDGQYTEIVSGDIKEGQEVITESLIKKNSSSPAPGPRFM